MENNKEVETAFVVLLHTDGTFAAQLDKPEGVEVHRTASTFDVYQTAKQIVQEIDNQVLTERIIGSLAALLMPQPEPTAADVVKDALKERGIKPATEGATE
ncbi:hypothetical protein UFOVP223_21 [uncultured Caudovirales phage]|uniref:Uncharacterized protein n=1 Tax=uncultured Caudovirales phage TaxID=2100421 RepID=A0A6J7WMJ2_9CAUD|nr:hypothetical protein UFOVP110_9 [uncultured Caudovirales phage]CAB5219040.1 hypothetical protein UFOVP223_21 [uncultured Caudovirales phage]